MSGKKRASFGIGGAANIFFHCFWAAALGYLYWIAWQGGYFDRAARADAEGVDALCELSGDAISVASQLGRLDFVSISLTILGVTLAVGALIGFVTVRRDALEAAREAAQECADVVAREVAPPAARGAAEAWLEKNGRPVRSEAAETPIGIEAEHREFDSLDKNDDR